MEIVIRCGYDQGGLGCNKDPLKILLHDHHEFSMCLLSIKL